MLQASTKERFNPYTLDYRQEHKLWGTKHDTGGHSDTRLLIQYFHPCNDCD